MTPIQNFLALAQATDISSRTLFTTQLGALISAFAAGFAAVSGLANLRTVREMRAARRPLIDVTTQAGEVEFTWSSQPTDDVSPHRVVRYFARPGEPAPDRASDWAFTILLENLSDSGATGVMSTLDLRPALNRRDVAMLGLSEGVGGNPLHRLSWNDGRYWLHHSGRGSGWFDSFTQPLGRISNVPALSVRSTIISHTTFENLLLLLYREALLVARAKSRDVMCRPRMIYNLSYIAPTGERLYRKYVIDLTIQHLTFKAGEHPMDASFGIEPAWLEFSARVTLTMRDATEGLPWRFRFSRARRVWAHLIDANQGHFGVKREPLRRSLRRAFLRWPTLVRWSWEERAKWWRWRDVLRERPPGFEEFRRRA